MLFNIRFFSKKKVGVNMAYRKENDKRWIEKNREHKNYLASRSSAKSFIRNRATFEDLKALEELIEARRDTLSQE